MFLASASSRLSSLSSERLSHLFGSIPSSPIGLNFKLALCKKLLTEILSDNETDETKRREVRAQPRARRPLGEAPPENNGATQIASKHPIPASIEIIRVLKMSSDGHEILKDKVYRLKFDLLVTYGNLQRQLPPDQQDNGWSKILTEGSLPAVLEVAFGSGTEGKVYREALGSIIAFWSSLS